MAGFDTVDPAYACVLPVSSQRLCQHHDHARIPASPKDIRTPIGSRGAPDSGKRLHLQAGVASKLRVLNHEI
jgi:hypothetical protein